LILETLRAFAIETRDLVVIRDEGKKGERGRGIMGLFLLLFQNGE
jgi:hypothetical protein